MTPGQFWLRRPARGLLCVLAATTLVGCAAGGSRQNIPGLPSSGPDGPDSGTVYIQHPVGDLDLEAMAQPGSTWVTDGPVHGSGPATPTVSLASIRGLVGTFNAVFLCLDNTAARPVTATYSWQVDGSFGNLACDPGPDLANTTDEQCAQECAGRTVNNFYAPNSAMTVMPRIEVPRGASWVLFAWLAPRSLAPGAGVSAAGTTLSRFTGYGLSFTYPRSWHSQAPGQVDATSAVTLVFEGTAPLRNACPVTAGPGSPGPFVTISVTSGGYPCGAAPVAVLPSDGVLVDWSRTDPSAPAGVGELGRPRTVGGYPAWLFSGPAAEAGLTLGTAPDTLADQLGDPSCRDLTANWVVAATVSTGTDSGYQMLACIRGPDTGPAIRAVLAMVTSLRLGRNPGR